MEEVRVSQPWTPSRRTKNGSARHRDHDQQQRCGKRTPAAMRCNHARRLNHVTLKGCCHGVGCSSDPADGVSSDLLINNSLLWNSRATSWIAVAPLNPKVLGSIPGAGTNNA